LQQVLETRRDALYWRHDGGAKCDILFHDHPSRIVVFLEHAKKRGKSTDPWPMMVKALAAMACAKFMSLRRTFAITLSSTSLM
jgi:hypothetical protein